MNFEEAMRSCGIIAILRGITEAEVEEVGHALVAAGVSIAEIPLNSPDPFQSIARMARLFKGSLCVGAGTVLSVQDVRMLKEHGGEICVSPDCNPEVIAAARAARLEPVPGVFTPTEAFAAMRAGAKVLKLFPAEAAGPATVKAWKAVLPSHVTVCAVGGVTPQSMQEWWAVGVRGFGIGSNIFKPGRSAQDVGKAAGEFVSAFRKLRDVA